MDVYLIDGTYELFRHFFAVPAAADVNGQEIGAVRGVLTSVLSMIERGATHIGVATDHVVESFRNDLYPGYKTSEGVPRELLSQFPVLEEALEAMGVVVWPMVYYNIFVFDPDADAPAESLIFDGLLAMGDLGVWVGREKHRKTNVVLQCAICAALGRDFLWFRFAASAPVRVVFIDYESKSFSLQKRYQPR